MEPTGFQENLDESPNGSRLHELPSYIYESKYRELSGKINKLTETNERQAIFAAANYTSSNKRADSTCFSNSINSPDVQGNASNNNIGSPFPKSRTLSYHFEFIHSTNSRTKIQVNSPCSPELLLNKEKKDLMHSASSDIIQSSLKAPTSDNLSKYLISSCKNCSQVLIVDDNDFNLLSLQTNIEALGLRVSTALNGQICLNMIKNKVMNSCCKNYGIIFMDFEMPIMDGLETSKRIRTMINNREVEQMSIIGCTAHSDKCEREKGIAFGMDEVIVKPIFREKIREVLNKFL